LKDNHNDIGNFLLHDPSGQRILPYLEKLSDHLVAERDELSKEVEGLVQHVGHVKDIVTMQQSYARTSGVLEKVAFHTMIEDSLRITQEEMDRHRVTLRTDIEEVPTMTTDRNKILQILLNLLRNAKDAVKDNSDLPRQITVCLRSIEDGRLRLQVSDSGVGIAPEDLTRVFSHGFTTKKDGHGFGLHFGALAARQLGGSLSATSEGRGRGATLTLELPIDGKNISEQRSTP
jgi:signal transduction histidine kinase